MRDIMNKKEIEKSKQLLKLYFENVKKSQEKFVKKSPRIPLAIPPYDWEEVSESLDSLLNMQTTMGKKVELFEKKFAKYLGVKYALMVNSGSSANLVGLSILTNQGMGKKRIKKDDEIITPAVTWATTVYPIVNVGAKPVFVDVEKETYNIDPEKIEKAITNKTKAIIPVHLFGQTADIEQLQVPLETAVGNIRKPSTTHWRVNIGKNTPQSSVVSIDKVGFKKLTTNVALHGTQAKLAHGLHQRLFYSFLELI